MDGRIIFLLYYRQANKLAFNFSHSKLMPKKRINAQSLSIIFVMVTFAGCEPTTGRNGTFVHDISGDYALTNISEICADRLPPTMTIEQNVFSLLYRSTTAGFPDATGTIDEESNISAEGSTGDGEPYSCTGIYLNDKLSAACVVQTEDEDITCSITYKQR